MLEGCLGEEWYIYCNHSGCILFDKQIIILKAALLTKAKPKVYTDEESVISTPFSETAITERDSTAGTTPFANSRLH